MLVVACQGHGERRGVAPAVAPDQRDVVGGEAVERLAGDQHARPMQDHHGEIVQQERFRRPFLARDGQASWNHGDPTRPLDLHEPMAHRTWPRVETTTGPLTRARLAGDLHKTSAHIAAFSGVCFRSVSTALGNGRSKR